MKNPVPIRAKVTLVVADEGDRVIYVIEPPEEVQGMVEAATTRLITLTRVKGMTPVGFRTRPDNIANVEGA